MKKGLCSITVGVAWLLAGCSPKPATVTGSYMLQTDHGLTYMQVTQVGNSIKGYMQSLTPKTDATDGVLLEKIDVSGEVEADTLRISPQSPVTWLQGSTVGGAWGGGQVILNNADQSQGTVKQAVFKQVTVEEWNNKVKEFRNRCALDAALWRREQDKKNAIAVLRQEEQATYADLRYAWRSLVDNKNGLQQSLGTLEVGNRAVRVMEDRLSSAKAAADQAERDAKHSTVFGATFRAGQVRYAAGQVEYQLGTVKNQRDQTQSEVDGFRRGVSLSWQKIAEVNAKMDSIQRQLHDLQGDRFPVARIRYQLGQATKNTRSYLFPDFSSQVLGIAPEGWYVAITGRPADGKAANCYSIISKTLSIGWIPATDVRMLSEQE